MARPKGKIGVIPGGPRLDTKERKRFLFTQAAYQQIPYKNLVPVKVVAERLRKFLKDDWPTKNSAVFVQVGDSDGNYDRLMIHYPRDGFHFMFSPLEKFLKKYKFKVVQMYDFVGRPEILIVRHRCYSVKSK